MVASAATTSVASSTVGGSESTETQSVACPTAVLYAQSLRASIEAVTSAARQLLARHTINSQGTVYHLTPRNAPIDYVQRIATTGLRLDQTVPGLAALHRVAAASCGNRTAQASWAIHYRVPVSVIAGSGGFPFIVKTRTGWRFWGWWCGADKTPQWRKANCL